MRTTPVRTLGTVSETGVRVLRQVESTYRDGAEEAALGIVTAAGDRSAASDEMIRAAAGWAQRYHFDPARANVVRCLDLPADARVLEIGAGCGPITRYLGETCAVVDALEPVQARAEVARVRTADLPNVEVCIGLPEDVPAQPAYDVVVVIGVLEYVGEGTEDLAPYQGFLDDIAARLVDGGTLVLAIENQLGVKYVVGAPEDHTNRVFDSIEGYPRGGRARTFSRRELEEMLRGSGLIPRTRTAFPDYKIPRVVFGDLPAANRSLLHRIPEFPSPDWRAKRPRLADERSVWRTVVGAGLDVDFGNSFLVLAGKGESSRLWPDGRGATFWSINRRAHLMMQTAVQIEGESVRFVRTFVGPQPAAPEPVRTLESDSAYVPGTDLPQLLADRGLAAAGPLLVQWLGLLDAAVAQGSPALLDLVPHNLVVADDDRLHVVDLEFVAPDVGRDQVVRRGVFWLAHRMTPLAAPTRWEPCRTVGEVMCALGTHVGLPADGSWIEQAIAEEADLITRLRPGPPAGKSNDQWLEDNRARLRRHVARSLDQQPLGVRLPEQARRATARARGAREQQRQRPAASMSSARRWAARAFPRGTRRRRLLARLSR